MFSKKKWEWKRYLQQSVFRITIIITVGKCCIHIKAVVTDSLPQNTEKLRIHGKVVQCWKSFETVTYDSMALMDMS